MNEQTPKPPQPRTPGGAPRRRSAGGSGPAKPHRAPRSYGQSAPMPEGPESNPDNVVTPKKPVAPPPDEAPR